MKILNKTKRLGIEYDKYIFRSRPSVAAMMVSPRACAPLSKQLNRRRELLLVKERGFAS